MRRRNSSISSASLHSTPVVARQWGSQRSVETTKQPFARCEAALAKLRTLPGFDEYEQLALKPLEDLPKHLQFSLDVTPDSSLDPVSLMRRLLRLGAPLTLTFNAVVAKLPEAASQSLQVLSLDEAVDIKQVKRAIYRFCESCVQELGLKLETDLFTISQIFSDLSGDLERPMNTLELLLNRLDPVTEVPAPPPPADQRAKIVDELLQTERKYVQDLETLLLYSEEMLSIGVPRETVSKICPRIMKLVEFQRRFLVGIEVQARESNPEAQNIGWLFIHLREGFDIYKDYTLGQKEATQTAIGETAVLMPLAHILEPLYELPATLLKPVQRILRYPLLLKEILKHTPEQWPHHHELQMALAAMHEMMSDVNETQRRAENQFLTKELQDRVRDWKGLELSAMGDLLLSGVFPVTSMGDSEQEYHLFLFERVLLCCRDRVTSKKTPLTKMRPSANSSLSTASRNSQSKSMSLELKGRIYLGYVTSITTTKLPTGGYILRLGWGHANDASEHGGFDVRLANDELAQMWESTIQRLASAHRVTSNRSSRSNSVTSGYNARSSQTSLNQFGRWITTNVGSIDEDYGPSNGSANGHPNGLSMGVTNSTSSSAASARRPNSYRHSSSGGIHFWDEASTPGSSFDAMRKLSVSSTSSQLSNSGGSGASRSSLTLSQQTTPPHSSHGLTSPGSSGPNLAGYRTPFGNPIGTPAAGNPAGTPLGNSTGHPLGKLRADSTASLTAPGQRRVRVHIRGDTFLILVPPDLKFEHLSSRVERKLRLCGKMPPSGQTGSLIFEYMDEDEDRVRLESDEDLSVAFEAVPDHHELSVYVKN